MLSDSSAFKIGTDLSSDLVWAVFPGGLSLSSWIEAVALALALLLFPLRAAFGIKKVFTPCCWCNWVTCTNPLPFFPLVFPHKTFISNTCEIAIGCMYWGASLEEKPPWFHPDINSTRFRRSSCAIGCAGGWKHICQGNKQHADRVLSVQSHLWK